MQGRISRSRQSLQAEPRAIVRITARSPHGAPSVAHETPEGCAQKSCITLWITLIEEPKSRTSPTAQFLTIGHSRALEVVKVSICLSVADAMLARVPCTNDYCQPLGAVPSDWYRPIELLVRKEVFVTTPFAPAVRSPPWAVAWSAFLYVCRTSVLTYVTYTERSDRIRIISARRAERHEQDHYYRENSS
jgi:hypothetical protein